MSMSWTEGSRGRKGWEKWTGVVLSLAPKRGDGTEVPKRIGAQPASELMPESVLGFGKILG